MSLPLILLPLLAGLACFAFRGDKARRVLLVSAAAGHSLLTLLALVYRDHPGPGDWFAFDGLGLLFLAVTSALFLGASVYAVKYLEMEKTSPDEDSEEGFMFNNEPEAVFTGCLLLFLSAMTAVAASRHMGLLWASVEATTLLSAPLIYFHRNRRSVEATWKYLLICSVGIALALMGNLFLGAAGLGAGAGLDLSSLSDKAPLLDKAWLRGAFIFLFVGYGTKMGLAPFHTWLPDAHSESPAVVSALLSGALLNCAFLGILRACAVLSGAGLAGFASEILVLFGLLSLMTAALFILAQRDYKRMLAYSSIEHMGILSLGAGLGGLALRGALAAAVGHSLTKAGLFFLSGAILAAFRTKKIAEVKGLLARLPVTGGLWLAGFFLITGTPPSLIFRGKFAILRQAAEAGAWWTAGFYLLFLGLVFAGLARIFTDMVFGQPSAGAGEQHGGERPQLWLPAAAFFALVVVSGFYTPDWLAALISDAERAAGGLP